jgi:hypothetical protein
MEEVEKTATKIMPFIQGLLASGHGVHILTAPSSTARAPHQAQGDQRRRRAVQHHSIEQLPSTGGLPTPVELTGLPDGGHARDEELSGGYALTTTTRPSMH